MSGEISLSQMTQSEYDAWYARSAINYRDEIIKNGSTLEEAQKKSDEDFLRLLPEGLSTPDQYVLAIRENHSQFIGTLWFGIRGPADNRKAYIYDIILDESTRGKGYGRKAMVLLEDKVKALGLKHIGLHVFGHNKVARQLYESLGYEITNLNMEKTL